MSSKLNGRRKRSLLSEKVKYNRDSCYEKKNGGPAPCFSMRFNGKYLQKWLILFAKSGMRTLKIYMSTGYLRKNCKWTRTIVRKTSQPRINKP